MVYVYSALGVYLLIGLILTNSVLRAPSRRMRYYDFALGAVVMPVLFVALMVMEAGHKLWKRLLIALDYNPPEEMRAGPKEFELDLDLDKPGKGEAGE